MTLRNALLVALLNRDSTGYDLIKGFDVTVGHYWHVNRAQLYAELSRMEADGLIAATIVVQEKRPNKRVFALTDDGVAEIRRFAAEPSEPTAIKDELLVKLTALEVSDHDLLLADIERRRSNSVERLAFYVQRRAELIDEIGEEEFVRTAPGVGAYLPLLRGIAFEQGTIAWCDHAAAVVRAHRERPDRAPLATTQGSSARSRSPRQPRRST